MNEYPLVAFAFRNPVSEMPLRELDLPNKYFLQNSREQLEEFVASIFIQPPTYILGLGMYSGRDKDKIRIETVCTSKFVNTSFESPTQTFFLPSFLVPLSRGKFSKGMGNSYCNLISYFIMKKITTEKLSTKYTFLHVPKQLKKEVVGKEIKTMLMQVQSR